MVSSRIKFSRATMRVATTTIMQKTMLTIKTDWKVKPLIGYREEIFIIFLFILSQEIILLYQHIYIFLFSRFLVIPAVKYFRGYKKECFLYGKGLDGRKVKKNHIIVGYTNLGFLSGWRADRIGGRFWKRWRYKGYRKKEK